MNHLAMITSMLIVFSSCAMFKPKGSAPTQTSAKTPQGTGVQSVNANEAAHSKASSLTSGWPQSSSVAAKEMVVKYGEPTEVTSDALIWRFAAPFKKVIVHKEVYSSRFPLLHQTAVEHVVDYDAPENKVDEIWNYNGSIVLDRTRGEMSATSENEAMNILSLNLAHDVMHGKMSPSGARIEHGKQTMNFLNGNKTAYTQALSFGNQINTADAGESITNKIRWVGETKKQRTFRQAEEERPKK